MGDERCVFPGDDPGTPARWLDPETAERLLRGESPDNGVDPTARDQAERLARTLDALAAVANPPVPATREKQTELPGEAAALAAFRAAHADRAAEPAVARSQGSDAGLFRIGGGRRLDVRRPRWGRPVRFGLAAALVAGMVGGVAVAAGTGVLPRPFEGTGPEPAASVPAVVTPGPDGPHRSPSPEAGASAPDGARDGEEDSAGGDPAPGGNGGHGKSAVPKDITSACGDLRDGRSLDLERRRTLERTAGGSTRVPAYCAHVLDGKAKGDGGEDRGEQDSHTGGTGRTGGTGHSGGTGGTGGTGGGPRGTDGTGGQDGRGDQAATGAQGGHQGGHGGNGAHGGSTGRPGAGGGKPDHPGP
ncbi:hypothetical protein [Streptomyces sp. NPDC018693]|uniref:hypothetical protein n=1 Tax=unclassified Streptomyces TaxID=2593676 RepID=UPI0037995FA0